MDILSSKNGHSDHGHLGNHEPATLSQQKPIGRNDDCISLKSYKSHKSSTSSKRTLTIVNKNGNIVKTPQRSSRPFSEMSF